MTHLNEEQWKALQKHCERCKKNGRLALGKLFAAENQPMSLAVLVDASSSMKAGKYRDTKTALERLLKASPPTSSLVVTA